MKYEVVNLEQKTVVGFSSAASNSDPKIEKIIGGLWQKLFDNNAYESIAGKINPAPICLYSDYEDTSLKPELLSYQMTIGCDADASLNPTLEAKTIPAGKYAKFFFKGNVYTEIGAAWLKIWSLPLERSFSGDFEEYLNESMEEAEVNIYIALK